MIDAELDAGTKLDATEVTGVEFIGATDLGGVELVRQHGAWRRAEGDAARAAWSWTMARKGQGGAGAMTQRG